MTIWFQMTFGYKNTLRLGHNRLVADDLWLQATQCLGHDSLVADDLWLQEHSTSRS